MICLEQTVDGSDPFICTCSFRASSTYLDWVSCLPADLISSIAVLYPAPTHLALYSWEKMFIETMLSSKDLDIRLLHNSAATRAVLFLSSTCCGTTSLCWEPCLGQGHIMSFVSLSQLSAVHRVPNMHL